MKQCPTCDRKYNDETLNFCLEDGAWLSEAISDSPTAILSEASASDAVTRNQLFESGSKIAAQGKTTSPTYMETARQPARNWRAIATGVFAMLGLFAISGLAYWYITSRNASAPPPSVSRTVQVTTWSGLDLFPTISRDGRIIAFASDRSGSFEIYVKQLVPGARDVQVTNDANQNLQPSISPDGSFIAFYSKKRGGIWVIPATGGTPKQLTDFGSAPAFSPDGSQVAFQSDPLNDLGSNVRNALPPSTIWVVQAKGGEPTQLSKKGDPPGGHGHPSWSPDGSRLVFDVSDWASAKLACMDMDGREIKRLAVSDEPVSDPIFSADGGFVYFSANMNTALQRISIDKNCDLKGEPENIFDTSGGRVRQMAVDGDGKRMVYSTLATTSNIWSARLTATGAAEPQQLTRTAHTRTLFPTFSPDGGKIAYQKFSAGSISHIWVINSDGSDETQIGTGPGLGSTWARDGSRIWFISNESENTSMCYVTPDGSTERKLFDFGEEVYIARPSPDGKWIAYQSKQGGTANVFVRSSDGSGTKQLTFDEEFAGFPAWSPDGRWLAVQLKRGDDTIIGVMPAEGGPIKQLTTEPGQNWVNDWSADGDKIIFAGQRNGIWNLYSVSCSTGEQRQLTNFSKLNVYVRYPVWSPANDRIAFEYAETTGNIWMVELK